MVPDLSHRLCDGAWLLGDRHRQPSSGDYSRNVSRYLQPPHHDVVDAVRRALTEDLTPLGDLSASLLPDGTTATATFVVRPGGVIAGSTCVTETIRQVDPELSLDWIVSDGDIVESRQQLGTISGSLESILIAERTALNFLMYLSGIATNTRAFVDAATGTAQVWDTRKTTPGLRSLEKAAVRAGGARNHRGNLSDWIMLKDNHLMGLSIAEGVALAKERWPARTVHVEVDRIDQIEAAVMAKADAILLDNMGPDVLREAVALVDSLVGEGARPLLEASGGIDLTTIGAVSETGVDMISTSKLSFGSPTLDIGLDIITDS